jgi:predicted kinase
MNQANILPPRLELAVLIGLPASGKSTYYRLHLAETHRQVSKDLLRNNRRPARRQRQLIDEALSAGESVAVDNTNVTAESRRELIEQGREHGARVVGYYFASTVSKSLARNNLRQGRARVPDIAIHSAFRQLERPSLDEGFSDLWLVKPLFDEMFYVAEWNQAVSV